MWRWAADPRGSRRDLALPDIAALHRSRCLVPPHAFRGYAHDLLGTREQYARKYHDMFHRTRCMALHFKPAQSSYRFIVLVWNLLWTQYILCNFGQRASSAVSTGHPMYIHHIW